MRLQLDMLLFQSNVKIYPQQLRCTGSFVLSVGMVQGCQLIVLRTVGSYCGVAGCGIFRFYIDTVYAVLNVISNVFLESSMVIFCCNLSYGFRYAWMCRIVVIFKDV